MTRLFHLCVFSVWILFAAAPQQALAGSVDEGLAGMESMLPGLRTMLTQAQAITILPKYCNPPETPNKRPTRAQIDTMRKDLDTKKQEHWRYKRMIGSAHNAPNFDSFRPGARRIMTDASLLLNRIARTLDDKLQALRNAPSKPCGLIPPSSSGGISVTPPQPPKPEKPKGTGLSEQPPQMQEPVNVPSVPKGPLCLKDKEALEDAAFREEHKAHSNAYRSQGYVATLAAAVSEGRGNREAIEAEYRAWKKIAKKWADIADQITANRKAIQKIPVKPCPPKGGTSVELEGANAVGGTNPFSPKDIEKTGDEQQQGGVMTPPAPPVVTPPVTQPPVQQPPVTTPPTTTPPAATPPVAQPPQPPLQLQYAGGISFIHQVGATSCPQEAGGISLNAKSGHALEVLSITVTGTIKPKLSLTKERNKTPSPFVKAKFNCSSPENGAFTGQVTIMVRDTVTGETATITAPATGTVNGG